jgi:putative PEP-CTERM system TPR-repeat lipoprotein
MLARASFLNNDSVKTRKSIEEALELDQRHLPSLVALTELEIKERHVKKATEVASKIQTLYPKSGIGYKLEGDVNRDNGNLAKAASAYEKAYKTQPNGQYAILLYQTRKSSGADEKAILAPLQDWVGIAPNDSNTRMLLATEYQSLLKNKEAIQEYELVKKQQPNNAIVWNNLAWLYFEQNDKRSIEYAEKALELAPKRPEIADTLGWILLHNGNINRGYTILKDAAVHAPHIPSIRYHLAVALHKNGNKDEARKELERLLRSGKKFEEEAEAEKLLKQLQ